jgi:glycosyltransferase involved in cell wall biosynthesis
MAKIFVVGARGIPDVEGGVEKNSEMLFPLLVQRGWHVRLLGLSEFIKLPSYRGVELRRGPTVRLLKTDKLVYYLAALRQAWSYRPDVVHMQGLGSAIMLWAYKLMGYRTVVRYGLADYLVPKWGFLGRAGFKISEFQLRFADAVIAVTPALAKRLAGRGIRHNVHVIGNALDVTDHSYDLSPEELPASPYILAVGRVTVQKNLHRLIEGFTRFRKDHPQATLVIVGGLDDAAYVAELRPLLNDGIKLLGLVSRSKLGPLYRNAHLFVNSSMHEGSSNAVLEAVSWGTPILLSDIPENRDFGVDRRHFFDPDDPAAIAAALERAFLNRDLFVADRSAFMTWDEVADRTSDIYRQLGLNEEMPLETTKPGTGA